MSDDPNAPWEKRPQHLQRWQDPRNGVDRIYFRKGHVKQAMKSAWGTIALEREVAAALAAMKVRPAPVIGTLIGAVKAYRGDSALGIKPAADFLSLSASTQYRYERWCDEFERVFVGILLADVDPAYLLALRNRWAPLGYEAANTALQVLKNVCKPAMITGEISGNPFELIDKVPPPHDRGVRNPAWENEEVAIVIADALARKAPGFARAIALGRWGGFRRQTICSVPLRARIERPNADGVAERRLYWLTEKKKVLCDRREDIRLTELLAETPSRALTVAYNADGNPWQARQLNQALDRVVERLAKKGKVRPTLTVHGLRHARGIEIALMGGSDAEIMVSLDHGTARAAAEYRKQADRLRLGDAMQDRVDAEIIRLRDKAEKRRQAGES
ncbi:MAG: site-specific integrase [Terricaulis sp.]